MEDSDMSTNTFDSENIPLVTRLEPGTAIGLEYRVTENEEAVWTVSLDSDDLYQRVQNAIGPVALEENDSESIRVSMDKSLRLNQDQVSTHEGRLSYIESLLGVEPDDTTGEGNDGGTTPPVTADSEAFGEVVYTQDTVGNLTQNMSFTWKILSPFNDTVVEVPVTVSRNTSKQQILNILIYSVVSSAKGSEYMRDFRVDDAGRVDKVIFRFKDEVVEDGQRPTFEVSVTETFDGSEFNASQLNF